MRLYIQFVEYQNRKILFLINPFSDQHNSLRKWNRLANKYSFLQKISWLRRPKKINLKNLLEKYQPDFLGIAGGDGTANFIVRSIYQLPLNQQPTICPVPLGFGNALAYNLHIDNPDQAIQLLLNGNQTIKTDLLNLDIPGTPICLFNMSLGFDAKIVHYTQKNRYIGLKSYVISAIRSVFDFVPRTLKLTLNNSVQIESETESLAITNMPYIGQNFQITPHSTIDNGLIDCVFFPTKYAYFTNLRFKGFTHPLYRKTGKVYFSAKTITVKRARYIQVDGDPITYRKPFTITVSPRCLKCLTN
ncbi:hypothetical protein KBC75_04895 [Candidatus Shapirobacteria bacterium]|nr:hypothetical protein [Candidatus Shapirobacteria bacterium]